MKFKTLRLVRTENARLIRRLTGSNNFKDKKLLFEDSAIMPTIATTISIENCIAVQYGQRDNPN